MLFIDNNLSLPLSTALNIESSAYESESSSFPTVQDMGTEDIESLKASGFEREVLRVSSLSSGEEYPCSSYPKLESLLDDVEGEVGLAGVGMRSLVTWLKDLSGVLLTKCVVDVLEHSFCEPCFRWRGVEGRLAERGVGANGKRVPLPTVETLICDPDDRRRQKEGDGEAHCRFGEKGVGVLGVNDDVHPLLSTVGSARNGEVLEGSFCAWCSR